MKKSIYVVMLSMSLIFLSSCQKEMVTISFNALYVDSPDPIIVERGMSFSFPTPVERVGFSFDGWYEDENYLVEAKESYKENITLYAKWYANTYTITFDTQGGELVSPLTYTYMETLTLPTTYKEGYVFKGWYMESEPDYLLNGDTMITMTGGTLIASYEKDYESELLNMLNRIKEADSISLFSISTKDIYPSYIKVEHVAKDGDLYYVSYQEESDIFYQYADMTNEKLYMQFDYYPDFFVDKSQSAYANLGPHYYEQAMKLVSPNLNMSWFDVVDGKFVLRDLMLYSYQQTYTKHNHPLTLISDVTYEVLDDKLVVSIHSFYGDGSKTVFEYEMINETIVELPDDIYEAPLIQGIENNHMKLGYLHPGDLNSFARLQSLNAYINRINLNGGIHGMTFEIVSYSHQNSKSLSIESMRKLLFEDQVYGLIMSDLSKAFPEMMELLSIIPNFPILGYQNVDPYASFFPFAENIYPMTFNYRDEVKVLLHHALNLAVFGPLGNELLNESDGIGVIYDVSYGFTITEILHELRYLDLNDRVTIHQFIQEPLEVTIQYVIDRFKDQDLKIIFMYTSLFSTDDILLALEENDIHVPVFLSSLAGNYDKSLANNLSFPVYTIQNDHIYDDLGEETDSYQAFKEMMNDDIHLYTGVSIEAYQYYQPIFESIFKNLSSYAYTDLMDYINTHEIETPFGGIIDYRDQKREVSFALYQIGETHFTQVLPYQTLSYYREIS